MHETILISKIPFDDFLKMDSASLISIARSISDVNTVKTPDFDKCLFTIVIWINVNPMPQSFANLMWSKIN